MWTPRASIPAVNCSGFEGDLYYALPRSVRRVRAAVALKRPTIKPVTRLHAQTATHDAFRFCGAVTLGTEVPREEPLARYQPAPRTAPDFCIPYPIESGRAHARSTEGTRRRTRRR